MKDKTIGIILLIFLFAITVGFYLNNGISFEQANLFGLVDLMITSFILMIVPLYFRIKNKELLSYESGKKICAYNSCIIFVISTVIMMIYDGFRGLGIVGALCYYFINMSFFAYSKNYKKE
ncbi:MAG: hypothetical protein J6J60_09355 [Clostridia bacterium]|nr:hypothetical protein [Clostridia bacterium]